MNVLTVGIPRKVGSPGISVLSVIKHTGSAGNADLSSLQPFYQRNALNVKRNANSSTSHATPLSAVDPVILILV